MRKFILLTIFVLLLFNLSNAQENIYIKNFWLHKYLAVDNDRLMLSEKPYLWKKERTYSGDAIFKLNAEGSGFYLSLDEASGDLSLSKINTDLDLETNWYYEDVPNTNSKRIMSPKSSTDYTDTLDSRSLNVENGIAFSQHQPAWHSAMWNIEQASDDYVTAKQKKQKPGIKSLKTPLHFYLSLTPKLITELVIVRRPIQRWTPLLKR